MMPRLTKTQLELERCPHCNVDSPLLAFVYQAETKYFDQGTRLWRFYLCSRCGGFVSAWSTQPDKQVLEMHPSSAEIDEALPERAREYLTQALNSLSAPAGAVMLAASFVDAMLKEKWLREGSLYVRIDKAATDHLITKEMALWAHEVRLDANDQRHADEGNPIPSAAAARHAVDFAIALGQFMYVLPAKIKRGLEEIQAPK